MADDLLIRPRNIGARVRRVEDPRLLTGAGPVHRRSRGARRAAHRVPPQRPRPCDDRRHRHRRRPRRCRASPRSTPRPTSRGWSARCARPRAWRITTRPTMSPLARGKVRYVGEPVVAVLAESRYLAEDAPNGSRSPTRRFPPSSTRRGGATRRCLHDEAGTNVLAVREFARGDVASAMAAAPVRVSGRFRFHRKAPAAIETASLSRRVGPRPAGTDLDRVDAGARDHPRPARRSARPAGHRIRVVAPEVGGGFGGKASLYPEEILCRGAGPKARPRGALDRDRGSKTSRRPATASTRSSTPSWGSTRSGACRRARSRGGRRCRRLFDLSVDRGARAGAGRQLSARTLSRAGLSRAGARGRDQQGADGPLSRRRPADRGVCHRAPDRHGRTAARRSTRSSCAAATWCGPRNFPTGRASGIVWDRSGFIECLDGACAAIDYPALRANRPGRAAKGRLYGIGVASYAELTGIGSRISAAPGMPINTGTETATHPARFDRLGDRRASASPRTARGSRRRWRRSSPTSSARGSRTSRSCRATAPSSRTAPAAMRAAAPCSPAGRRRRRRGC